MHTNFSDGQCTLEAMVERAKQIGFTELGVSDHLIVHKNMRQSPSWKYLEQKNASYIYNSDFKSILDAYRRHCDDIHRLARRENIKLYVGFEVDYFPYNGWEDELKWFLAQIDYDYLHSGNHFFCSDDGEQIINMTYFNDFVPDLNLQKKYILNHFATLKQAVATGMFNFLAHIDYLRRFCDRSYQVNLFSDEIADVLAALKNTDTALEISTKGLRKAGDYYPCGEILQKAAELNIAFVISDDAHKLDELGDDFAMAEAELKKYGITNRFKL